MGVTVEQEVWGQRFKSAYALRQFPDETLGSIAARYHLWSCNDCTRRSLFEMFGCSGYVPNSSLPSRLSCFTNFLAGTGKPVYARAIAVSATLLPYFTFFGCRNTAASLANYMINLGSPKASAGLLASTFGASDSLKYCPICISDDRSRFGIAYWHRTHQLPEVVLCLKHGTILIKALNSTDHLHRHALMLPPFETEVIWPSNPNSTIARMQLRFANHSASLLELDQHRVNSNALQLTYQSKLIETGLARRSGRVNQVALRTEMSQFHNDYEFLPHGERLRADPGVACLWLERIVRKPRTRQHPVLHLLLVDFLFGSPEKLMQHLRMPLKKKSQKAPNLGDDENERIRILIGSHGLSLRAAAIKLGRSVNFVRVRAMALSVRFSQKPHRISKDVEIQIFDALMSGMSVSEAATETKVSAVSVYRIVQANPKLRAHIENRRLDTDRSKRRERFTKICSLHDGGVKNILKASPTDYAWLRRNDRAWLMKFARQLQRPHCKPCARVDWADRDATLMSNLQFVVKQLLAKEEKPVRITLSEVGRQTNSISLLHSKLHKLPKTKEYLAGVVETTLGFQTRRVEWAIKVSGSTTISTIARMAGINDGEFVRERLKVGINTRTI